MVRSGNNDVIAQVARGLANFAKCESRAITQGHKKGRSLLMDDVTSYGPSHLGSSFPPSSAWLASLLRRSLSLRSLSLYAHLPSASVTSYGPSHLGSSFPSSSAWLASLLRTCEISSIQSLLPLSNRAFTPFAKLLIALSTKPLACGCLTEAKR
nr:armadillo repeat-containing kinesin-like protein 1 [Tanacetum cinerariifolium]